MVGPVRRPLNVYLQLVERKGWGNWHSVSGPGIGQDMVQPEVGDPLEMSDVPGNEFKVVIDCGGRDLEVSVREDIPSFLQFRADHPEDTSGREIEGQESDGGKDAFLNVG